MMMIIIKIITKLYSRFAHETTYFIIIIIVVIINVTVPADKKVLIQYMQKYII